MNWRRGLLRVWLLASVIWIASLYWAFDFGPTLLGKDEFDPVVFQHVLNCQDQDHSACFKEGERDSAIAALARFGGLAVGVPLVVLLSGVALGWAASGFRKPDKI